jgi:hypothetical protein
MARLTLLLAALAALLFYGAGCTRRVLDDNNDGGANECANLSEADCAANKACALDYCSACSCTATFASCRRVTDKPINCPLYSCPQQVCSCDNLAESACIAEEKSLGCTPFYCPDCNGGQTFTQCLSPNAGQPLCSNQCPQKGCHSDKECTGGQFCLAPGASPGCGVCNPSGCADDSSCGPGQVCDFAPCVCNNSGRGCIPGCSTAGCAEGQTCGNSNHCIPTFCQNPSDCPAQFQCDVNSHNCSRKACLDDSNCPGGFCVENSCYSSLGTCSSPVP